MNSKILQIALRITLIKEEFTEKDILEAVMLLESLSNTSALLSYLAGRKIPPIKPTESQDSKRPMKKQPPSSILLGLKKESPGKFKILSNLEYLLLSGSVLLKTEELNQFAEHINKEFVPGSSRQDTIEKLMGILIERTMQDIEQIFQEITSLSEGQGDAYQQLASFILSGKMPQELHILPSSNQLSDTDHDHSAEPDGT